VIKEYYQKSEREIFEELKTSPEGLSEREAQLRLAHYGPNILKKTKEKSLFWQFILQFTDALALLLIGAALLSLFIGAERDGVIILGIVFLNAIIGFSQEYKAARILTAFKKHLPTFSTVIREGKIKTINRAQIVPGDIILLKSGDAVPADGRIFAATRFKTNEISLTGESHPRSKKIQTLQGKKTLAEIHNMVFMGTTVLEGDAKAVVVSTGMQTAFGKIAHASQQVHEGPTPLQKEMLRIGKTTIVLALGMIIVVLGLFSILGKDLTEGLRFSIAAAVSVVPEGLPSAIAVALSLGAQRMIQKKALVKKLLHTESLGSVTAICTDKTGTLTTGEMTVAATSPFLPRYRNLLLDTLVLCNNASVSEKAIGDPIEIAFLKFAQKEKIDFVKKQKEHRRIFEIPFSAKKRMMAVVCQSKQETRVYVKGAVEEVVARCELSEKEKQKIKQQNDIWASQGWRVLAAGGKKTTSQKHFNEKSVLSGLEFWGLVAVEDPPRQGVKEALAQCRQGKIKVYMISGDYGVTALAVARQLELVGKEALVVTGEDLHAMDDEKLKEILKTGVIFARIEPEQKLRIVKNLQEMGEIVAVTGDGVNDAPALAKADIGVAMGKIGTDVAKETADMILLDDHFATIVKAIKEGRRIFDNAAKFVFYVFSSNFGELAVALLGLVLGLPLPLLAIQILAIDLGTDVLPSLALGVEKAEAGIMKEAPRAKRVKIMNLLMLERLLFVGGVMGGLALLVFLVSLWKGGWHYGQKETINELLYRQSTTATYTTLVFCQIANAFSSRSYKPLWRIPFFSNRQLIFAEMLSFLLLLAIMHLPFLQSLFHTAPITPLSWILAFFSMLIFLFLAERLKEKINLKSREWFWYR